MKTSTQSPVRKYLTSAISAGVVMFGGSLCIAGISMADTVQSPQPNSSIEAPASAEAPRFTPIAPAEAPRFTPIAPAEAPRFTPIAPAEAPRFTPIAPAHEAPAPIHRAPEAPAHRAPVAPAHRAPSAPAPSGDEHAHSSGSDHRSH